MEAVPLTVLVVDDEPSIRLLCRVNLELDGFRVLEASSLAEARAVLAESRPDVVLLDVHLGNEQGPTLLPELAGIPVALLTGSVDVNELRRGSAEPVIPKPFPLELLTSTVRRLVGKEQVA